MTRDTPRRLPDFLIIGAMKAGTTTLYRDLLAASDEVFFPADKEPGALLDDRVLSASGRDRYAALFAHARPHQQCGEASTAYTKLPDHPGVAERAHRLLGGDLKLVYLMRHPIDRLVSQYRHAVADGQQLGDINDVVREQPSFTAYSSYAYQLQPWIERFGADAVLGLQFEQYVENRRDTVQRTADFLGLRCDPARVQEHRVFNASDNKPLLTGVWRAIHDSPLYRRTLRPLLTADVRERVRHLMVPAADTDPGRLDSHTWAELVAHLGPDTARLAQLLGDAAPRWDLTEPSAEIPG